MRLVLKARRLHYRTEFQGLPVSIENRKGSIREGVDTDGRPWKTKFEYPYGYIRLTEGVDGDHIDCYIGPSMEARQVYVIHQNDPATGRYDEDKVMLGFTSAREAKAAYLRHYNKAGFFGSMSVMGMEAFKRKIADTRKRPRKIR